MSFIRHGDLIAASACSCFPFLAFKLDDCASPRACAALHIAAMTRLRLLLALFALFLSPTLPANAEQQDVAAAVRGVVRVVIIATRGEEAYFVGHGSGFVVAPDKVLTNAHVVELMRAEKNLVIGIVPSEGKRSYGGKLIAYSPGNDLALIQLKDGRLPVTTFYAGGITDGQHVTAIGYPATVDRAQGLDLNEMIQPLEPVKTSGTVSTGRSSQAFDTILHTAPMAAGNSGGPLVDDCGRVLGVNSMGSVAESEGDAEFGFAVSNREVASFLRQAGVQFQRTAVPCRSLAELDALEAKRAAESQLLQQQKDQQEAMARDKALADARNRAEQEIVSSRENMIALSGVILLLGGLALGGAMMFNAEHKPRERKWAMIAGGVLIVLAIAVFLLRPSFSGIEDTAATFPVNNSAQVTVEPDYDAVGDNLCRIDENRSRIIFSDTQDIPLHWAPDGCANGSEQYVQAAKGWDYLAISPDQSISVSNFDPATGTYKVERFLPDSATMAQANSIKAKVAGKGCTADQAMLSSMQQAESQIRAILSAQPNERLVYQCARKAADAPAG